jgi:predicted  nucleic acid-binding Zn-ribbon protein
MIGAIRVAMLVAALAAPSLAAAQTAPPPTPPAGPDVLRELLVEVRGLRAAMERAATVGARIQLLVARVQMQEQRIAELSRRAITVREELSRIDTGIAQHNAMIKQFERSVSSGRGNADEQREFEGMIEVHKQQMAITEKRRQELLSEDALLAQQIAADQSRWSDVNNQLDELERSLTPRKQ